MDSFYGGINGQSFTVKTIFTTYYALQNDLSKGWSSPVSVGEFVIISYGMPNDMSYDGFKAIDINTYGKTYNSTLWQKTYDESANGNANGLGYKLLASMTGNTPRITLTDTVVLNADEYPDVAVNSSDVDYYVLTFSLPQSQILHLGETTIVSCNIEPSIDYDDETDINNPVISFTLPRSQVIEEAVCTWINAGENPTVRLDTTTEDGDAGTIDNPILRFELPVAQTWQQGDITVLNADEMPYFMVTSSEDDVNVKILSLWLPQSQVMQQPTTTVVNSSINPSVTLDDTDINKPFLQFTLPRATHIEVGELDEDSQTDPVAIPDGVEIEEGDFYLNKDSGYLYEVIQGELVFQASLQVPKPKIGETEAIDPYNEDGTFATPTVTMVETSKDWTLTFGLPRVPDTTVSYEAIGVEEEGSITTEVVDTHTLQFNFTLPRGANIFAGSEIREYYTTTVIDGAMTGDLYINTDTGYVYKLSADGEWIQQDGSIQGPVGDALHFVANYVLTATDDYENTLENTVAYIEANYTEEIAYNDIFAVSWTDTDGAQYDYWCYQLSDGTWSRVQLTGGIASLLASAYTSDENKTYTTIYINSLIGVTGALGEDLNLKTYTAA